MLVLSRKKGQSIMIGGDIKIVIADISGETVRLGIEAPASLDILREEIYWELQKENMSAVTSPEEALRLLKNTGGETEGKTAGLTKSQV